MKRAILSGLVSVLAGVALATAVRVEAQAKNVGFAGSDSRVAGLIGAGFFSGPFVPDPDLDLPADSTIDQQIGAGKKELAKFQQTEPTLDQDVEFAAYMKDIVNRLLAAQDVKPPYPIEVHVSTGPSLNAFGGPGGQILFYSEMVEQADTEAQMVAIVAHEMSHELHNDFAFFWKAAKNGEDSYGNGGLLEKSREIEQRADLEGAQMMYNAGWDPKAASEMMTRLVKLWRVKREGHRVFYSSHPEDGSRVAAIDKEIATLPPKEGLIEDSPRFQELKKRL